MSSNDSKLHTCGEKPDEHSPGFQRGDHSDHADTHHHHDHCHGDHDDDKEFYWLYEITRKGTMTPEDSCKIYDQHADDYEKLINGNYCQHLNFVVNDMMEIMKDKNGKILDVGAGTGANGKLLKQHGYNNIDALDGSKEMLKIAKTKNVYDNLIHLILKGGVRIPNVENDTYSAAVMSGVFCPNHCDSTIFPELIRVVKPGGYICWDVNVGEEIDKEKFNSDVEKLCKEGKWKKHKEKVHEGYCGEEKATTIVTIMEVL